MRQTETVAKHAGSQVDQDRLLPLLGNALLREDRNFHAIQMIEAQHAEKVIIS